MHQKVKTIKISILNPRTYPFWREKTNITNRFKKENWKTRYHVSRTLLQPSLFNNSALQVEHTLKRALVMRCRTKNQILLNNINSKQVILTQYNWQESNWLTNFHKPTCHVESKDLITSSMLLLIEVSDFCIVKKNNAWLGFQCLEKYPFDWQFKNDKEIFRREISWISQIS